MIDEYGNGTYLAEHVANNSLSTLLERLNDIIIVRPRDPYLVKHVGEGLLLLLLLRFDFLLTHQDL